MTQTYQARYRLLIGESWREPGQLVPEAVTWFRVDSLVHHGRLIKVEVTADEFDAAVAQYSPDLAEQITGAPVPVAVAFNPVYPNDPPGRNSDIVMSDSDAEAVQPEDGVQPQREQPEQAEQERQGAPAEQPKQPRKASAKKAAPRHATPPEQQR